ncbi:plasmid pRiA4b ORF-3 family protein [Candidatus Bipolaricaulota bacterium]|nr:plasmid pRiA4b ORF-3 family protein [Candidatus Bipolaricaulota bacterium]
MSGFSKVYQFKITLKYVGPPIWRRIQVPESYTFWDLHVAIQDAMGWTDSHLHMFLMPHPKMGDRREISIPFEDDLYREEILHDRKQKIADWFSESNPKALYIYDFGDSWEHEVKLEKILPREQGVSYPRCVAGRRACPPEDCGGVGGYEEIVAGESEFQEEFADYDPEHFDPSEVVFEDPEARWKWVRDFFPDVEEG